MKDDGVEGGGGMGGRGGGAKPVDEAASHILPIVIPVGVDSDFCVTGALFFV